MPSLFTVLRRCAVSFTLGLLALMLAQPGEAAPSGVPANATSAANPINATNPRPLSAADLAWLGRVAYGVDAQSVLALQQQGRKAFLAQQLAPGGDDALPPAVQAAIAALPSASMTLSARMAEVQAENQRINQLANDDEKQAARQQRQQLANQARYEAGKRHLLRAVYSPWQLKEQMSWFWLNHFSVFADKGNLRWLVADYEEQAIRPYALGRFRNLLRATMTHPAMLEYLDNAQSSAGKINENYARELLELHTLGVQGGYSQQDVQELARVLTGLGVNYSGKPPRLNPAHQAAFVAREGFEFNPARHDLGDKTVLGQRIAGSGMAEVEQVLDLLSRHPATARFISRKLATYFVADEPPPALVARMAKRFIDSDGDIAAVLRTMFESREFEASLALQANANTNANTNANADGGAGASTAAVKMKDPMQFVASSLRLAYCMPIDGAGTAAVMTSLRPAIGWLNALGEPLYGRVTPDGWPLVQAAWASPAQMVRRFEIARAIGSGNAGLFNTEDNQPQDAVAFPQVAGRLFWQHIEPTLSNTTRQALTRAASQAEWNTLVLSAPEWMTK